MLGSDPSRRPPSVMGDVAPVCQEEDPAAAPSSGESMDLECPICYQEYNQHNKCPRMLECLHVFCTECLQRIQLTTHEPGGSSTSLAIPCPLCRHLTPSETGDALTLPCNSRILSRLPQVDIQTPASGLATVTQRVVLSLDSNSRDSRFIILPTVSLRVQQMHPDRPYGVAPGLVSEQGVIQQSKKTLLCVQLLAVVFWVLFVITCVVGVVFGPHLFKKSF